MFRLSLGCGRTAQGGDGTRWITRGNCGTETDRGDTAGHVAGRGCRGLTNNVCEAHQWIWTIVTIGTKMCFTGHGLSALGTERAVRFCNFVATDNFGSAEGGDAGRE